MNYRSWLVSLYPRTWRERFGEEFEALLEDTALSPGEVLDVLAGAVDAQLHLAVHEPSDWRTVSMGTLSRRKQLLFAAIIVLAAAVLDLSIMALSAFAGFEGMTLAAVSIATAGAAATAGFVALGARSVHGARGR